MPNLNAQQIVAIIMAVLGVLTASTAQLTDLFGPGATKIVVSVAGLLNSVMSSVLVILTGQSSMVKAVQAMPGVDKIIVNDKANQTLASLATDPAQTKMATAAGSEAAVKTIAKGG